MKPEQAKALREPFPPETIGKLPKGGIQLDYVGHAACTDRLLQVDPEWNWEPFAIDERGLPALDAEGNLWIRLTVCGVTRPGVGDGPSMKIRIGDALRNAAMRFGVALDLWAKEDLHADAVEVGQGVGKPLPKQAAPTRAEESKSAGDGVGSPTFQPPAGATDPPDPELVTARKAMWATFREVVKAGAGEEELKAEVLALYGVASTKELTVSELRAVSANLKLRLNTVTA